MLRNTRKFLIKSRLCIRSLMRIFLLMLGVITGEHPSTLRCSNSREHMLGKCFFPDSHLVCHPSIICELSQLDSVNCDLCLKLSTVENEIKPRFVNKYLFFNNSSNNKSNKKSLPAEGFWFKVRKGSFINYTSGDGR